MTATTLVDWEAPKMKSSLGPLLKEKFNLEDWKRLVQQRTTNTFFSAFYLSAPPYNVVCTAPGVVLRLRSARFSLPGASSPDR